MVLLPKQRSYPSEEIEIFEYSRPGNVQEADGK